MNDWNIQARAHACQPCGKVFVDKQVYHTVLFDDKQVLHRLDICEGCWQTQYRHGTSDRKGFVSYWQGVYEAPPPAPADPIQRENAESLLRKLIELNDPKYIPASYILAAMLERRRVLKVKEEFVRDGQRVFAYEHSKTGDLFTVPDPKLQLDLLDEVQRDVADLLEHGLPGAAPEQVVAPHTAITAEAPRSEARPAAAEAPPAPNGVLQPATPQ